MEWFNREEIEKCYDFLKHKDETELRFIDPHGNKPPIVKHVTNKRDFASACISYNGQYNIYAGINERKIGKTEGKDVKSVKTVVIDIDVDRPNEFKKEMATNEELVYAEEVKDRILNDISQTSQPLPVVLSSGNGFQLWFAIPEIELTDKNRREVEDKLQAFQGVIIEQFSTEKGRIDKIGDLPRIIKVWGTLNIKGSNTEERPHRVASVIGNSERVENNDLREIILGLDLKELEAKTPSVKTNNEELDFSKTPPCIKKLFEDYENKNGEGWLRIVQFLASYFKSIGYNEDKTLSFIHKWNDKQPHHEPKEDKEIKNIVKKVYSKELMVANCDKVKDKKNGFPFTSLGCFNLCNPIQKCEGAKNPFIVWKRLNEKERVEKKSYQIQDFKYNTEHLPYFNDMAKVFRLHGKEYKPALKGIYYQKVGLVVRNCKIDFADLNTDSRIQLLFCCPSGKGKNNLKSNSKEISKRRGLEVEEPTAFVSDQLIGKVIEVKKKVETGEYYKNGTSKTKIITERVENRGYFSCDDLHLDEALEFIQNETNNDIVESRGFFCIGTDPYGRNEISKKLIDHFKNERIKYFPSFVSSVYIQPEPIKSNQATRGFLRRFLSFNIVPKTHYREIFRKRLSSKSNPEECLHNFCSYLDSLDTEGKFHIPEETYDILEEYASHLIEIGYDHSEKAYQFTKLMEQPLIELLLKFSCIIAGAYNTRVIMPEHIKIAYMDLVEIYSSSCDFISSRVKGRIDFDGKYGRIDERDYDVLSWLYNKGAECEESSDISIKEFIEYIQGVFNYKPYGEDYRGSSAYKKYIHYLRNDLIKSKQTGKNESRVWVCDNIEEKFEGGEGEKGENAYKLICDEILQIISTLKDSHPSNPSNPNQELKVTTESVQSSEFNSKLKRE